MNRFTETIRSSWRAWIGVAFGSLAVGSVGAQQSLTPRPAGDALAVSRELFGSVALARPLPAGGGLINDVAKRRLVVLDSTLQTVTIVADSASGITSGYGGRAGALIPYIADSSLLLDATSESFL